MTIRTAATKGDRQISVRLTGQVETDRTDREKAELWGQAGLEEKDKIN